MVKIQTAIFATDITNLYLYSLAARKKPFSKTARFDVIFAK